MHALKEGHHLLEGTLFTSEKCPGGEIIHGGHFHSDNVIIGVPTGSLSWIGCSDSGLWHVNITLLGSPPYMNF